MKTHSLLTFGAAGAFLAVFASGCFQGPSDKIAGDHSNNDVPVVIQFCDPDDDEDDVRPCETFPSPGPLASGEFTVTFGVYDVDSTEVTLWEECPFPDQEGAAPILKIGWSPNGGSTFRPIVPAHLKINGEVLEVPTCAEVNGFDEPHLGAATTSTGMTHTLTWNTLAIDPLNPLIVDGVQVEDSAGNPVFLPYVLAATDVTLRISVNDNSFTSDPGDSAEFQVANVPSFSLDIEGSRPGDVLPVELTGVLTHWDGTTVVGSSQNLTFSALTVTSETAATATLTHGADPTQQPLFVTLITPGAGIPTGDEVAPYMHWGCAPVGAPSLVVEYETALMGDINQFICDQNTFNISGDLVALDGDNYVFTANTSGTMSTSFDWSSTDGAATDYDLILAHLTPNGLVLAGGAGPFGCGDCCSEAKPEVCTAPVVAGETYFVLISHYAGEAASYDADFTGP